MPEKMIKTISPSTNKVVCEVPVTSLEQARSITKASQQALIFFRGVAFAERWEVVVRALGLIQVRKMELGRPIYYSHKEIETMQKRADYLLKTAEETLADLPW